MARAPVLRIRVDREYLEYVAMKQALECIVEAHRQEPWTFTGEDAAELAADVLAFVRGEDDDLTDVDPPA